MPPWRQRTYDPPQFNPYSEKEATLAGQEWDMQRMGEHPGIPGFEALMAESLEALGEPGMVERLLRRLGEALGSHKVVLFCPLPGSDDPLTASSGACPMIFWRATPTSSRAAMPGARRWSASRAPRWRAAAR